MTAPILTVAIRHEQDTVAARQRARHIARLLGFDHQDQTRISTAVSEIARNVFRYAGGGQVEYILEGRTAPQLFLVKFSDSGPGIRNLNDILEGRYQSATGMGLGIIGARRLVDQFNIESVPGKGTTVWLKKLPPKRAPVLRDTDLQRIASELALEKPQDAFQELQYQNQELLGALEEVRARQADLTRVNHELEDTNRGVVALYAELDEKADHLRRADELKSRFLSHMSHEFRSPLNSILALTGLLQNRSDGDLTPEQAHQVGYIRRAAQDLLELVNDLLDLAKVEAGKIEANPVDFEPANLFAALRGMLRPLLINQSIELIFEDPDVPRMYSDEGKVSQILRNFISNALKFTERGEIRVRAVQSAPDRVSFSVSDTGIGIAPQDRELIFQDFTQVDHPIQRRVKGTGLGLPLSRKLATLLGGTVEVESEVGSGSTFTLRIPLRYAEPASAPPVMIPDSAPAPTGMPVLVIEDRPEMMMVYRSYLKDTAFHVVPATTTREAEEILEAAPPQCIVLDILLRSENTWELLAKVKSDPRTKNIPVVVVSTIEDQAKALHLGADQYLLKPIERATLISELSTLTRQQQMSRILVIDDDESFRYLLRQEFKHLPVLISEASNGADGIRLACKLKPSVICLDLVMPEMSGFETLQALKADPVTSDIPVIVVTSQVLSSAAREGLSKQTAAIVSKEALGLGNVADTVGRMIPDFKLRQAAN